jgi:2,5-diketo-D-gluconate reductase B
MPSIPILNVHGVDVPRLGLGTYRMQGDTCRQAVAAALSLGYRHIDTAEMYENEEAVAAGVRDSGVPRSEVFLATKVWRDHLHAPDLARAAQRSLRRLGTDYVDLLLQHWPNDQVPLEETLGALVAEREAGRARLIGVCNFPAGLLSRALELVPDLACNQVEYHPMLGQNRLLVLIREHGMFLTAYSPIARNRLAGERVLQEIAATHGVSVAKVALAWLLAQDRVVPIPKASSREHLEENLAALDVELTPAELGAIDLLPKDQRSTDPGWVDFDERSPSIADTPRRLARGAVHAARRLLRGGG